MNISVSTHIDNSADKVWQAITDFEHCADWIDGIIQAEVIERPDSGWIGFKWQETRKMFGKEATETMWITDYVDGEFYITRAENCGAIYVSKLTVIPQGNGAQLTMEFSGSSDSFFVNLMSSIMSFFIKKSMIKMLEDDLLDIKKHVETQ